MSINERIDGTILRMHDQLERLNGQLNNRPNLSLMMKNVGIAGLGALSAGLFTSITPLGGAIFGVGFFGSEKVISWICDKIHCQSFIARITKKAFLTISALVTASALVNAAGLPLTMASAAVLTAGAVGITSVTVLVSVTAWFAYNFFNSQTQPHPLLNSDHIDAL